MSSRRSWLQSICSLALFAAATNALKFDLTAYPQGDKNGERCIRNFVGKDTLVVVTAIVSGSKGDGQQVNINVRYDRQHRLCKAEDRGLLTGDGQKRRFETRSAMSTASPRTSLASSESSSRRMRTPPSMFALRTS
jgi:hypothetical protein